MTDRREAEINAAATRLTERRIAYQNLDSAAEMPEGSDERRDYLLSALVHAVLALSASDEEGPDR
jgi:hypothetical protein